MSTKEFRRVHVLHQVVEQRITQKERTDPGKTRPVLIVQAQALLDAQHPPSTL